MAAARIPPELFHNILASLKDEHDLLLDYEDREDREEELQYLSDCSSVCVYWANFIRPRMFQIVVLRSARDLYGLLALLRMPCSSRIWPIAHCLRTVAVFYRFTDYFWCHDLQRLHTYGVREEISLRIHIRGYAPWNKKREPALTVRHPLFYTIPRIVPFHRPLLRFVDLILDTVNFTDGAGLFNLLRDISCSGILPRFVHCIRVTWNDGLTLPLASLDPIFPLDQQPHVKPFDVTTTGCTDNSLVAFAIRSCIGRRGRDVVMLDPSDANRFQGLFSEWASLIHKASLTPGPQVTTVGIQSRVISDSPLFGREGDNSLSKANQGMTGYFWRTLEPDLYDAIVEFGFYMRSEQGHGLGSAQTAYICSIVIDIFNLNALRILWQTDPSCHWNTIFRNALQCPMLETLEVSVNGWDELQEFVSDHRETLAIAESRGRLKLCLLGEEGYPLEDKYRRQVDLSDVPVIDQTNTDESDMESEP